MSEKDKEKYRLEKDDLLIRVGGILNSHVMAEI